MLEVRDIWKKYEGTPLLCGVSFQVAPGETVCLLGASGSGKSTLLRIIAGLESLDQGRVLWQGEDVMGIPVHQRNFGLMFQEYALFPHMNVSENVAFGLRMQGQSRSEIDSRVKEALEQVNLISFAHRKVTDLSGGEQQRVALARAIAPRPRLLMLDEPLGALDRALKEEMEEEIRLLLHSTGIPAIYVTHDQEEAFAIADRLILLNNGQVEQSGRTVDVFSHPVSAWTAHFLGLSNLLPGKVIHQSPLQAETDLGVFQGECPIHESFLPGEEVTLLLRPAASLYGLDSPGENKLQGTVKDCVFRGGGFRVMVDCSGRYEFSFFLQTPLSKGDQITLSIKEEDVQFFKGQNG